VTRPKPERGRAEAHDQRIDAAERPEPTNAAILSVAGARMTSIVTTTFTETPTRPLPVDLVDGPAGLLYLLPRAPLTLDDCEALSQALAFRAAALRGTVSTAATAKQAPPTTSVG
jgi:hypothetical protein